MKKLNTILICILFSTVLNAQTNDAQLWSWVSVNKTVAKDLVGTLEQQVRLDHNMTFPKNIFTEMRMGYRFNKHIKYTISYRFMNRGQAEGGFITGNRFTGDLRLRYKNKPFILFYRNRMQREYRVEEEGIEQINYTRNKLALALDLDKNFSPYASFEIYYHLNKAVFNKNRYTLGVELEVFYRIQQDYNVNGRETAYVIGIGFSHSLKGMLFK